MADPRIRQIKIKTGIVKRLAKEEVAYITEAKKQEERIERLKAEGGMNMSSRNRHVDTSDVSLSYILLLNN
ncbi:hypothetical protein INR49_030693 [Caranx melampygus]|nr:hypothetical protein INR49_030693 [Caranx melampygus]